MIHVFAVVEQTPVFKVQRNKNQQSTQFFKIFLQFNAVIEGQARFEELLLNLYSKNLFLATDGAHVL